MLLCKNNGFKVDDTCLDYLKEYFSHLYAIRDYAFANGRTGRNFFDNVVKRQANRIASDLERLSDNELTTCFG